MDKQRKLMLRSGPLIFALCILSGLLFSFPVFAAETQQPESVRLDAERVSYDDESGKATAEGDAVLHYKGSTIQAERIDYDATTQKVKASPLPGQSVVLQSNGKTVTGDSLDYDLNTEEGVLTGAKTSVGVGAGILYVSGGNIEVYPYDQAVAQGIISPQKGDDPSYIGLWHDVSVTTCALDHPHYRIETKSITFIPGRRLIAKRPRLYLGKTYVFTWPMDYIVLIQRKALQTSIMPYVQSSEGKGTGVGFSGAFGWDSGSLTLGAAWWSEVDLEWRAAIDQSLGSGFGIRGGVDYSWDKAWDEKIYHPYGSLYYERNGWHVAVNWTKDEYIEDQKDSLYEYQGRLNREPEVVVRTPWMRDSSSLSSWYRIEAIAGSYQERTPQFTNDTIARYGAGIQSYFEAPLGNSAQFFWNIGYAAFFYDKDDMDQQIADGLVGLRYRLGSVELASGYGRRFVWGESPMFWDSYRESEKVYQKIRVPLGKEWYAQVRGSYDLRESMVDEVDYALQWINDCMKWELLYKNDRTSGGNDRFTLSVSILAFPDTPASFGQYEDEDPFDPPKDLPGIKPGTGSGDGLNLEGTSEPKF